MDLDRLLTAAECAAWLGLGRNTLARRSTGRRADIPAIRLGRDAVRFHPRMILAKFASDAGVSPAVISASLTETKPK